MIPLHQIPVRETRSGPVLAVIDTPRGSRAKYKYDERLCQFRLSKLLPLGAAFPCNFGFLPSTRGEDGDALDILVIMDEPVTIGSVVPVELLGVLKAEQKEKPKSKAQRNDRLIGILDTPYNPPAIHSLKAAGQQWLDEIEHFFVSYNQIEGREYKSLGRGELKEAEALLEKGRQRYGSSAEAA